MDAFETITARLFEHAGHWVKQAYKFELAVDRREKLYGNASNPHPEIDLLTYRRAENCVYVVECKSYLSSDGIRATCFEYGHRDAEKYRLFYDNEHRALFRAYLSEHLISQGMCDDQTIFRFALCAGKFYSNEDHARITAFFGANKELKLFDDDWVHQSLRSIAGHKYSNHVVDMVVKALNPKPRREHARRPRLKPPHDLDSAGAAKETI